MVKEDKATWKSNYFSKLIQLLEEYPTCFIVGADNVGSNQMKQIRMSLRGTAVLLMGKNTMMRKAIRGHIERNQALERLLPHIKENVGLVFTREQLVQVRDKLLQNKMPAPARKGAIAPCPVVIPAQNTGLGPEKTSFFQALSIPTKISKGTIEIINDVHILKEGDKVGASEATLLNMLNISPFSYGLVVKMVYDKGTIYEPRILDIKPEELRTRLLEGAARLAAVCLEISYPTVASAPHSIVNGFKNLLAVAAVTDVEFKEAERLKEYLKKAMLRQRPAHTNELEELKSAEIEDVKSENIEVEISNASLLPLPDKGILLNAKSDQSQTPSRKKTVPFADGIKPGEGTSLSGGEDRPLSSPPLIRKPSKKRKKGKVKGRIIRVGSNSKEESDEDDLSPPPPPPGTPPPEAYQFIAAGRYVYPRTNTQALQDHM